MTVQSLARFAALVSVAGVIVGCNPVPIDNLERTFSFKVETSAGTDQVIKIDFLWVVDNSTSMCEEQVELAKSFKSFTDTLENFFAIDARLAVTSADMQCDLDASTGINAAKGVFNQVPASTFPASCLVKEQAECKVDSDCPSGEFTCSNQNALEECDISPNGAVNTVCRYSCDTDQDCADYLQDSSYECKFGGCIKPPDTVDCFGSELPAFLSTEEGNVASFPCIATLGVYSQKCFKYEQGLRAALSSIDPSPGAPQEAQAKSFLRDDAYLVVIIVSDEDDCSTIDGANFGEEKYNTCAFEPTTDDGGILVPVRHYVNRFKGIKSDPSKVIVAAIAGDALPYATASVRPPACETLPGATATEPSEEVLEEYLQCARQEFQAAKTNPRTCFQRSYICSGDGGTAEWGSRYQQLTEGFGTNGLFLNICEESGISNALDSIAQLVVKVVNKVCLPRQVSDASEIQVVKTLADGSEVTLEAGSTGPEGYSLEPRSADCAQGGVPMPLINFVQPPEPGEKVRVVYQGCVDSISGESSCTQEL